MSLNLNDGQNRQGIELVKQAHGAELSGNFKHAYNLHVKAASLFNSFIMKAEKGTEERRRAKLNFRASTARRDILRPCIQNNGPPPPRPLPSQITVEDEFINPVSGTVLLSMVEMGRSSVLFATPEPPQQPQQSSPNEFLTNLLSPSLPSVTYHVYSEKVSRFMKGSWIYFHVKDDQKNTLYTFSALKQSKFQIPLVTVSRATEYTSNCATIAVAPIKPRSSAWESIHVGRTLRIQTETQKEVLEAPDRFEKEWIPRRFTYGGRRFVWKKGTGPFIENLYEVKEEWSDPESKTGKILDQTHSRPLVWGDNKVAMEKVCIIHMAGGLDQMFREFLLASQVTRRLILLYGHN